MNDPAHATAFARSFLSADELKANLSGGSVGRNTGDNMVISPWK